MPMGLARWMAAVLVAIGLIAQSHALVRHHGVVLSQGLGLAANSAPAAVPPLSSQPGTSPLAALEADLATAFCLPSGLPLHGGDDAPAAGCPICQGTAAAYLLAGPNAWTSPTLRWSRTVLTLPDTALSDRLSLARPHARGPPLALA